MGYSLKIESKVKQSAVSDDRISDHLFLLSLKCFRFFSVFEISSACVLVLMNFMCVCGEAWSALEIQKKGIAKYTYGNLEWSVIVAEKFK